MLWDRPAAIILNPLGDRFIASHMTQRGRKATNFRVDTDLLDSFDREISRRVAEGDLEVGTDRSEVLRQLMREYVDGDI